MTTMKYLMIGACLLLMIAPPASADWVKPAGPEVHYPSDYMANGGGSSGGNHERYHENRNRLGCHSDCQNDGNRLGHHNDHRGDGNRLGRHGNTD